LRVFKQNCSKEEASDKTLPYTCYLVTYTVDGKETYDLAISTKQVEMFDYYWDLYKKDFIGWVQSDGRMNPKLWQDPSKKKPTKTK